MTGAQGRPEQVIKEEWWRYGVWGGLSSIYAYLVSS